MGKTNHIENYYDNFAEKLIWDYIKNNPRTTSAIKHVLASIPKNSRRILDIGCGIGWSTHEISKHLVNSEVHGVDLSPGLLAIANKLFSNERISFTRIDLTSKEFVPKEKYNAIVLIDVYEHIPLKERRDFHNAIKKAVIQGSRIILTCPTVYHQEYLRKEKPEGLQPVDEDVRIENIQILAHDVGGEIIFFSYKNIWRLNDYFHAVIEIKPKYERVKRESYLLPIKGIKLEEKQERVNRVKTRLPLFSLKESKKAKKRLYSKLFRKFKKKLKSISRNK